MELFMIKRFEIWVDHELVCDESEKGEWVKYEDCLDFTDDEKTLIEVIFRAKLREIGNYSYESRILLQEKTELCESILNKITKEK
jgi:hypothetical protein